MSCGANCIYHVIWEDFLRSISVKDIGPEKEFDEGRILSTMDQIKFRGKNGKLKSLSKQLCGSQM